MKNIKKIIPHLFVIITFISISLVYFSPLIEGKEIEAHDTKTWKGISKEVRDFRDSTGEEALWTNSLFGGMPAYLVSIQYNANLVKYISKILHLGLPRPANLLWLYLLGFYILLLSLKIDYRISAVGAIAFAFSSYFFIIIQAGHMTKAHAIAYLPMVVASVLYTYRRKIWLGGILTATTVALQLYANHFQVSYYTALILFMIACFELFRAIKSNNLIDFLRRSCVLVIAALLASGTSITRLMATMEYGKYSIRGPSELSSDQDNKTSGLDKDYATQWSYGIAETMTLLIPNFHGGASTGSLTEDSETYTAIKGRVPNAKKFIKNLPLYWGDQPITSGPTYAGSIVIFLFFIGLFVVKSYMRGWLLLATILSIMLAWGKNFMFLTEFFLDYFPAYNKFRAVSMILIIAEFTLPLLAFIGLNKFLEEKSLNKLNILKKSFYITGGIALIFMIFPSIFFDFAGSQDDALAKNGWPIEAIQEDRISLLKNDAFRSLIFISLAFSLLFLFLKNKIKKGNVILIIGLLILMDMWTVNKRYLNNDHFEKSSRLKTVYPLTPADQQILSDKDLSFRVFNQSVSTFNDANTSYYHKSIGGYHGAKLRRYQELIENHISQGNSQVINMLNTKYFISPNRQARINPGALGNAWFIKNIQQVDNADQEIAALNNFNPKTTAVVDRKFSDYIPSKFGEGNIQLTSYKPNHLIYQCNSNDEGLVVFSEIYYDKGWKAYIDGEFTPHFRVNYVLRAMHVPSGNHQIEFKFVPDVYKKGEAVSLASSILLLLFLSFGFYKELKD